MDIDACIVQRIGKSIPEFFAAQGEAAFRAVETQVLAEVLQSAAATVHGSTGGGVVTAAEENVRALRRQNGEVLYLDRPLAAFGALGCVARPV